MLTRHLEKNSDQTNEFVYPFIPYSTVWIAPIEDKYLHLNSDEISKFYIREFSDPFFYPKETNFYISILQITHSVEFDSITRGGNDWAYSKAYIKQVLTPEQWNGDLFRYNEIPKTGRKLEKYWFNYFDYIKAWDDAFLYEKNQKKHTWFFQFRNIESATDFPQWFIKWFYTWGANQIIFPDKIRCFYEQFEKENSTTPFKYPELIFTAIYRVPWIMKWEIIKVNAPVQKFGETILTIPYLGRKIFIKWWDKYEFFREDSIHSKQGLIRLTKVVEIPDSPEPTPNKDMASILKELLSSSSKAELKKQLREILNDSDEESIAETKSPEDDYMQDSQDPNA